MAKKGIEDFSSAVGISYQESLRTQMQAVPLRKMSQPEEVASVVRYLLSNDQVSITGQSIDINNGAWMS